MGMVERVCTMMYFRRQWYRRKRFVIPICFLMILIVAGAILGGILGFTLGRKDKSEFFLFVML